MIVHQTDALTAHGVIHRITTSRDTLRIHTIPGEEWHLSCYRHKTLLVDVYTLAGTIAGKRPQRWECGRLCELLIKLLRYGRKAQYISHLPIDNSISSMTRRSPDDTLEEDAVRRLKVGDIVFHATGEPWRLTGTYFGKGTHLIHSLMYHIVKEDTLGTPKAHEHMYKCIRLENVLLDFLLQKAEFIETAEPKILTFKGGISL